MEKTQKEIIEKVQIEMHKAFNHWNENKKNGQEPVAIQDLDFWADQLATVLEQEIEDKSDYLPRVEHPTPHWEMN